MIFVWGRKRVEKSVGRVADFCPICRDLRAFQVVRLGMAGHVYGIPLGEGQLLGYARRCKQCGVRVAASPEQYTGFDKGSAADLETLIWRTFPGVRAKYADRLALEEQLIKNRGGISAEVREGLLMEPFVLLNPVVESSFSGRATLDAESAVAGFGTFLLSGLLFFFGASMDEGNAKDLMGEAAGIVLLVGIAFSLVQLARRPHRYVRRQVLPSIARALRPLQPAKSELQDCQDRCTLMRMRIGKVIKPDQVWMELQQGSAPAESFIARRRLLVTEIAVIAFAALLIVGFGSVRGSHLPAEQVRARTVTPVPIAVPQPRPAAQPRTVEAALPTVPTINGNVVFIPVPKRTDMVHDPKRKLLYIAAGDSVMRYQMDSRTFLPPLTFGGDLRGIDISPDGRFLAVADATNRNDEVGFHLVNLESGADSFVPFTPERNEAGTFSVAFDANDSIWSTSTLQGSGGLWPLRKFNPATGATKVVAKTGPNTMLTTSADRQFLAYADGDSSPGAYGRFACDASALPASSRANGYLYEIGLSRDGGQLALPNYAGLLLSGGGPAKLDYRSTLAAAYHPTRDYVFVVQAGKTSLSVLETAHYTLVKELDLGTTFNWIGNHAFQQGRLRFSNDGKFVFCTAAGGIRYTETGL